jgi:hypothetical protein
MLVHIPKSVSIFEHQVFFIIEEQTPKYYRASFDDGSPGLYICIYNNVEKNLS